MTYAEKLKDPRWQRKRLEIMQRDNFMCRICDDDKKSLNVHHRYYLKNADPWDYPDDALLTFCEDCHKEIGKAQEEFNKRFAMLDVGFHYQAIVSGGDFQFSERWAADALAVFLTDPEFQRRVLNLYRGYTDELWPEIREQRKCLEIFRAIGVVPAEAATGVENANLYFLGDHATADDLVRLRDLMLDYPGNTPVYLHDVRGDKETIFALPSQIRIDPLPFFSETIDKMDITLSETEPFTGYIRRFKAGGENDLP